MELISEPGFYPSVGPCADAENRSHHLELMIGDNEETICKLQRMAIFRVDTLPSGGGQEGLRRVAGETAVRFFPRMSQVGNALRIETISSFRPLTA